MIPKSLQPEQQLCLIFSRRSLPAELADRAEFLIRRGPDWDRVWNFSVTHRIFPLVASHLESFEQGIVPPELLKRSQEKPSKWFCSAFRKLQGKEVMNRQAVKRGLLFDQYITCK